MKNFLYFLLGFTLVFSVLFSGYADAAGYGGVQYSVKCTAMGSDTTPEYDVSVSNCYTDTIDTGTTTMTFSNPAASGFLSNLSLKLTNGGSQTINWPASVDWPGGTEPTLTTSGVDWIECVS